MSNESNNASSEKSYEDFLTLFSANQKWILGHLYHLLRNHHDAEDVFQRTSLTLWEKFEDYEPGTNFRAWACQVAFYQAKNFMRSAARDRHCFSDTLLSLLQEERQASDETLERQRHYLTSCISKLPEKDRHLLQAVYEQDLPIKEIAEQMGKSAQTLYNRMNKLRHTLQQCILAQINLNEG